MSERPTMSDGSPFDPTDSVHVAERLSVVATERDRLAARLAEVEAERDRLDVERDEHLDRAAAHRKVIALQGIERDETEAERDRLAQELEDAVEAMRKAARGPSPASAVTGFLARFPREGDA